MLLSSVQKIFTLVVFSSAAVCCAVLGILLLVQDNIAKAGIATLTFNFTNIHLPNHAQAKIHANSVPDLLQPLASEAQGAASVLATAIATAANNAQSAAGAVATAATAAIEGSIPRNCSLGTKGFCVGFANHTQQCSKFPLNVSRIIPEAVISFVADDFQALQPLAGILARVTQTNVEYCLRFGLGFILIMGAILVVLIFTPLFSFVHFLMKFGISLVSGVVFCVLLLAPTVILYEVQKNILNLQPLIQVEKGVAISYGWGASGCAILMMLLVITTAIFI
ncbi:hypothetical protein IFR04_003270 [Cadophora malorum]|uniref:Uncharacterized protein n=1 Tax=Cadophora malorum TaxID=108018 RepID=A0A8H7WF50_9HELO|nr:hypothetical protein IFR04_003270 [Cadophora malorum]